MTAAYPKVLVSILHYRSTEDTLETLAAFRRQTYPNLTIQVIDNASPDTSAEDIRQRCPAVTVIRLDKNGGYTRGNNYAFEQGVREGYDYVLISNHDLSVEPDAVAKLVETAECHADCGIVGAVEEDYDSGAIRVIGGAPFRFWCARGGWTTTLPSDSAKTALAVAYVQGSLMLVSRRALLAGIRLDERLFMYCEEIDVSFQLQSARLQAYCDLRVRIRHKSFAPSFSSFRGYFLQRNRLYLCRKHAPTMAYALAVLYTAFIELPIKVLIRAAQGHPGYAWVCCKGFLDGLLGRMGKQGWSTS